MKKAIILLILLPIIIGGCSNKKTTIPEIFKTQLMKFLEEGSKINAKASQGVSFIEFNERVANTKAAYDLIRSTWPESLAIDSRNDFEKALKAWDMTLNLWKLKISNKDNPTEPEVNGYAEYVNFEGDRLITETREGNFIVEHYRGKKYLPFDGNISVLLTIGGESFNKGRDNILKALQ